MDAALASGLMVAAAEIGDKTQLLALLLASASAGRFPSSSACWRRPRSTTPWPGSSAASPWPRSIPSAAPRARPDLGRHGRLGAHPRPARGGPRCALCRGRRFPRHRGELLLRRDGRQDPDRDSGLAARFATVLPVVIGTTIGMMAVDVPTVLLGHLAGERINLRFMRYVAAALFAAFGILALAGPAPGIAG